MNAGDAVGHRSARLLAWLALGAALLAALLLPAPAHAHSGLVRSDPADGGSVAVGRTQLTLWYDEPIALAASRFRLATQDGRRVRLTVTSSLDRPSAFVQLESEPLPRGLLVLDWQTVSALDGHPTSGTITFGVGRTPPAGAGSTSRGPDPTELLLRWVQLSTLILAAGVLVAPVLLRRSATVAPEVATRTSRAGPAAGLAALFATCLSIVVGPDSADVGTTLTTTPWGTWWIVHVLALVIATVGFIRLARTGFGRAAFALTSLGLVIAAVADTAAGHAAELPGGSFVAVGVATVHVAAAGVWLGTMVVLAVALLPSMRRDPATRRPLLATVWRAFSPVAAVCLVALVASGLYLAGLEIPTVGDLTSSWYGWAATAKTAALVTAALTAAGSTLLVHPAILSRVEQRLPQRSRGSAAALRDPARFVRLVTIELALLATAVVLASVMTTVPAPRDAVAGDSEPLGTAVADGLFVSFLSLPADVGERRIVVRVNAVTRPQPGPVTSVDLLMTDASGHSTTTSTTRVQAGTFGATVPAPPDTNIHVWVTVHRAGASDAVADLEWTSASADVGPTGFRRLAWSAAGLLALVGLLVGALALRRRRRGAAPAALPPESSPPAEREPIGAGHGGHRHG